MGQGGDINTILFSLYWNSYLQHLINAMSLHVVSVNNHELSVWHHGKESLQHSSAECCMN